MSIVLSKHINKVTREIEDFAVDEMIDLIDAMSREDPLLMSYALDAGAMELGEDELDLLIYITLVIRRSLAQVMTLPKANETLLGNRELANFRRLTKLRQTFRNDFGRVMSAVCESHNQAAIMEFVSDSLQESELELDEESMSVMFGIAMTIVDCLDPSPQHANG